MKIVKYSKSGSGTAASNGASGSGSGGNTTVSSSTVSRGLDRTIWGQSDSGDDVDGSMLINGNVTIKAIVPPVYEPDDEDDDGEDVDEESGGGNLTVECKITADEVEAENVTVNKHLYVNLNHSAHNGAKKCLVDVVQSNTNNISQNADDISALQTTVQTNTTNIAGLTGRVEKLESRKNPGYYWTTSAQLNSSNQPVKPVEPLTYIGADTGSFEVTESKAYLWRTVDGESFTIVSYWIPPEADKYYVASTLVSGYYDANNKVHTYPAGFVAFCIPALTTPYGKSGWTTANYTYHSQGATAPVLNYPAAIFDTIAGVIPRVDGYANIWEIANIVDANDYTKWKHLQSGSGASNNELVHTIPYADWGNRSSSPGYGVFVISDDNIVADQYLGQNTNDPFITGEGTSKNWNNGVWRKSFLMHILSDFLWQNKHFYSDTIGWSFNWGGPCNSTGYGGQWTCRFGGIIEPDSNDFSNIGYYSNASISFLMGYVYSETTDGIFKVDFRFDKIRLGKKLSYSKESFTSAGLLSTTGWRKYWDVSYEKCYYKFTDAGASGN